MTSKLTRERIEWLNYAATGLAANGTEMTMSPQDVIALTECCLAAMDSEPVVFTDERNLHHIAMGRETSLIWGKQNSEAGDVPLYRHAQQPVVPDESYQQLSELYHAQEKRLFKIAQRIKGPAFDKYSHLSSQAIDVLEAAIFGEDDTCRAAMLQAGNSPAIPEGYVMVPVEPTDEMLHALYHFGTRLIRPFERQLYQDMLAAAPQEVR
ncbi:TPA: hypothetical protein ACKFLM_005433 [Klebsiella oxytoca]